jgi:hypothetical protein
MSQRLTLELNDEVYADLQRQADAMGVPVVEWILASLINQSDVRNQTLPSTTQQEEARQRFRNHAGAVSLRRATDVDNESNEADLARAYATDYKE